MVNTKIQYCDETANFVSGCLHGCNYPCYARRMATRLAGVEGTVYHRLKQAGCDSFDPAFHWDVLTKFENRLTSVRKPRRVFIGSMSDVGCKAFFHSTGEKFYRNAMTTGEVLQQINWLCKNHERHTFLLLSKNPLMFKEFEWTDNTHIGTSIDRTNVVTQSRLRALYASTAAVKWVSVEPLLDPAFRAHELEVDGIRPDWVVIGGLSGKRPLPRGCCNAAERIILWCQHHGIPVFCKDNLPRLNFAAPQQYP